MHDILGSVYCNRTEDAETKLLRKEQRRDSTVEWHCHCLGKHPRSTTSKKAVRTSVCSKYQSEPLAGPLCILLCFYDTQWQTVLHACLPEDTAKQEILFLFIHFGVHVSLK